MKTVFDIAQARLRAVENMDRVIAREREQEVEIKRLRENQSVLLLEGAPDLFTAVHEYERELVRLALKAGNKSVVRAARLLGVKYQTLVDRMNRYYPELLSERRPIYRRRAG